MLLLVTFATLWRAVALAVADPAPVADALDGRVQALIAALHTGWLREDMAVAAGLDPSALPPDRAEEVARARLDPLLVGAMASYQTRSVLGALTPAFWREALSTTTEHAVAQILVAPPGSREADLLLANNPCLPQIDERRAHVRRRFGPPSGTPPDADDFGPPAPIPSLIVQYDHGAVLRVQLGSPAGVRALGCDAPALRFLEVPEWQRAWEYGPTTGELSRYGVPDTKLSWVAWVSGGTVMLTTASAGE